jgi:hypothetical protein
MKKGSGGYSQSKERNYELRYVILSYGYRTGLREFRATAGNTTTPPWLQTKVWGQEESFIDAKESGPVRNVVHMMDKKNSTNLLCKQSDAFEFEGHDMRATRSRSV